MTLTVGKEGAELNHAVALWGYEIDTTLDMITGLWISDSDSTDIDSNFFVPVVWDDNSDRWEIPGGTFESWHLVRVNVFYAPAIPEPQHAALLLLLPVCLLLTVRSRRRCH